MVGIYSSLNVQTTVNYILVYICHEWLLIMLSCRFCLPSCFSQTEIQHHIMHTSKNANLVSSDWCLCERLLCQGMLVYAVAWNLPSNAPINQVTEGFPHQSCLAAHHLHSLPILVQDVYAPDSSSSRLLLPEGLQQLLDTVTDLR